MKISVLAILALFVVYVGAAPPNRDEIKGRLSGTWNDLKATYNKADLSFIKGKVRALKDKVSSFADRLTENFHFSPADLTLQAKATLRQYLNRMKNVRDP